MLRLFGWLGLKRQDPRFEQEVHQEIQYLTHAFPDDPLGAARDRMKRRSRSSSEYRVISAAAERLGRSEQH